MSREDAACGMVARTTPSSSSSCGAPAQSRLLRICARTDVDCSGSVCRLAKTHQVGGAEQQPVQGLAGVQPALLVLAGCHQDRRDRSGRAAEAAESRPAASQVEVALRQAPGLTSPVAAGKAYAGTPSLASLSPSRVHRRVSARAWIFAGDVG